MKRQKIRIQYLQIVSNKEHLSKVYNWCSQKSVIRLPTSTLDLHLLFFSRPSPTVCSPMDCSIPNSCILHYLLEFAQSRVHWVDDAIQPSHPVLLVLPSIFPTWESFPVSRLFTSGGQSIGASASVLLIYSQGWFPLVLTGLILQSWGL